MDLVEVIKNTIEEDYNGLLDCEKQRADLRVYINGVLVSIKQISSTDITYEDGQTISLLDSDIQTLSYIDNCIRLHVKFID
tara:strand:- start:471 stop:713 length:243 start_codon:yes stop_codon:yes gene_type:complete